MEGPCCRSVHEYWIAAIFIAAVRIVGAFVAVMIETVETCIIGFVDIRGVFDLNAGRRRARREQLVASKVCGRGMRVAPFMEVMTIVNVKSLLYALRN